MGKLFGTDGIRGVANSELTPELVFKISKIAAYYLTLEEEKPFMVVGKDTRISGDMLEGSIISGLTSLGVNVYTVGVISTPGVAYLIKHLKANGGVMISASHNPLEDNGIKFFNAQGFKLSDNQEEKIEALYYSNTDELPRPIGEKVGRVYPLEDSVRYYIDYLKSSVKVDLTGYKIVLDCANGAVYNTAPFLFRELGAEVIVLNDCSDGKSINVNCGSTHPERVAEAVQAFGAQVGFSFDGDGDRLIAVDEKGRVVDGDYIMAICGKHLKDQGKLDKSTIVTTVMSNLGLDIAAEKVGLQLVKTRVGDRYVLETMLKDGYNFGGEQSGHIIFLDYNTTGDGILTALTLARILVLEGRPFSQLTEIMSKLPQVLKNAQVKKIGYLPDNPRVNQAVLAAEKKLGNKGRVLVRPSGTEPLVRVMLEGQNEQELHIMAEEIIKVLKEEFSH
ncbi:phosphoglucosamine mutase [Candidatus Contubernalis alkaliaceticus]|uniref:phosphoglucosamine mutase n=1 Tax=Candidatus Contubernalis alkaliaceticus TaxID=338645 RepID=UPI001F4BF592|nr:phosphoglucosamine mutase [Candidatus Contubernalis alkalaceticus]UNC90979.1 phosphoglucosamine mutase [Candidatus Contubernalis alkalaceticus]